MQNASEGKMEEEKVAVKEDKDKVERKGVESKTGRAELFFYFICRSISSLYAHSFESGSRGNVGEGFREFLLKRSTSFSFTLCSY